MGRIRRGGYVFEWWAGDHPPRHVHVSTHDGEVLGRVRLADHSALDAWIPPAKVVQIIRDLQEEGRL